MDFGLCSTIRECKIKKDDAVMLGKNTSRPSETIGEIYSVRLHCLVIQDLQTEFRHP